MVNKRFLYKQRVRAEHASPASESQSRDPDEADLVEEEAPGGLGGDARGRREGRGRTGVDSGRIEEPVACRERERKR